VNYFCILGSMFSKKYYIAAILILVIFNLLLIAEGQRRIKREKILTAQLVEHEKLNARYLEAALVSNRIHPSIVNNTKKIAVFYFLCKSQNEKGFKSEIYFINLMDKKYPGVIKVYFDSADPDTFRFKHKNDFAVNNWVKREINLNCSFALIKDKNNVLQHTFVLNPGYPVEFSQGLTSIASILQSVYDN